MQQKPIIFWILFFLLLVSSSLAIDYGEGDYGAGKYGGTSGSSGGGNGGGGSSFVDASVTDIITQEDITPNVPVVFDVTDVDIPIDDISITSDSVASNVQLSVTALDSKPFLTASPSKEYVKVYKYLDIKKSNITDDQINSATIKFIVSKKWLSEQNLLDKNIVLLRWKDLKWNELETSILESNTDSIIFIAKTPGFSYFAIALKNTTIVNTPPPANPAIDNGVNNQQNSVYDNTDDVNPISNPQVSLQNSSELTTNAKKNILPITLAATFSMILFVIIVIGTLHLWRKKKLKQEITDRPLSEKDKLKLTQYIEKAKQAKITDEQIAQNLRKAKLSEEQIKAFNVHSEALIKK